MTDIGIHEALREDNFTPSWRYLPWKNYEDDVDIVLTREDDVHAFAMTMVEVG